MNVGEESIPREPGQVVLSPEQVTLHLPIAGPTSRMMAYGIDYLAVILLEVGVLVLLFLSTGLLERLAEPLQRIVDETRQRGAMNRMSPELLAAVALFILFGLVIEWAYFTFFELTTGGRSPGKIAVGLRVVCDGGFPISARASFVRNLLRAVDALPMNYAIGLVAMIVSKEGKRLGDLAAGTIVVRHDRPPPAGSVSAPSPAAVAAFRFDRAQIERVGSNELTLMRITLRRLDALAPDQSAAALERATEVLRAHIGYTSVTPDEREGFLRALLAAAERR